MDLNPRMLVRQQVTELSEHLHLQRLIGHEASQDTDDNRDWKTESNQPFSEAVEGAVLVLHTLCWGVYVISHACLLFLVKRMHGSRVCGVSCLRCLLILGWTPGFAKVVGQKNTPFPTNHDTFAAVSNSNTVQPRKHISFRF